MLKKIPKWFYSYLQFPALLKNDFQSVTTSFSCGASLIISILLFIAPSFIKACIQQEATSPLGIDLTSLLSNSSSTPLTISRMPSFWSKRPPGWIIVYGNPLSINSFSAFLFHSKISPDLSSPSTLPIEFKKFSGCVPIVVT